MRQADVEFTVRTDLALEEREKVQGSEIPGIRVREWEKEETGIRVTEVAVCDERGEKALGKPVGMYLTVEAASLAKKDDDYHREVSEELAGLLRGMLKEHGLETEKMGRPVRTLVVGLGNPEATPDGFGTEGFGASSGDEASGAGVWDGFLQEARVSGLKRDRRRGSWRRRGWRRRRS